MTDVARPLVDQAGDAEADRGDLSAGAPEFLDRVDDASSSVGDVEAG